MVIEYVRSYLILIDQTVFKVTMHGLHTPKKYFSLSDDDDLVPSSEKWGSEETEVFASKKS